MKDADQKTIEVSRPMTYVHRTLRRTFNVLGIIPGMWCPDGTDHAQILLNLHTAVEVHSIQFVQGQCRFRKVFRQPFFSKVASICKGPKTDMGLDSFIAVRDFDILLFVFNTKENIFTLKNRWTVDKLAVSPTVGLYSGGILTCSSASGGLLVNGLGSESHISYATKPAKLVTFCFQCANGKIGRIEEGPRLSIYNTNPYSVDYQQTFKGMQITDAFEYLPDVYALCVPGKIIVHRKENGQEEVALPGPTDFVTQHVFPSAEVSNRVILLTNRGMLLEFNNNVITPLSQLPNGVHVHRIFALDSDHIYMLLLGGDIVIETLSTKTLQNAGVAMSALGAKTLYLGSATQGLAPHGLSFSGNHIITTRQGITVASSAPYDAPDPIVSIHTLSVLGRDFVVLSHASPPSSRLLEVFDGEVRTPDDPPFVLKETSQIIAIATLKAHKETMIFQIFPDSFSYARVGGPAKEHPLQNTLLFCAHNTKQLLFSFHNRQQRLFYVNDKGQVDSQTCWEVAWQVHAFAISTPDPTTGFSEFVAYGAVETQGQTGYNNTVKVQVITNDQATRTQLVASYNMPTKVTSVQFLNPKKLVVGLEDGSIVIGKIDRVHQRLEDVQLIHYGNGPCHLAPVTHRGSHALIAITSRPGLITLSNKDLVKFKPIAMNPISAAASVNRSVTPNHGPECILTACGRTLSIVRLFDNEYDVTYHKAQEVLPGRIVALKVIDKTQFAFVATENSIYSFDEIRSPQLQKAESYEGERIMDIDVNVVGTPVCLGVVTRCRDNTSVLRLYNINISQTAVQPMNPIMTRSDFPITAIRVVSVGIGNIVAAAGDTLLYFKQTNTPERTLQLATHINGMGINIRHIVYTAVQPGNPREHGILYLGDSSRSVKLLRYIEDSKHFQLFCEEGACRSVSALAPYGDSAVCGGDTLGNVFIFEYAAILLTTHANLDTRAFKALRRLGVKMNYNVGDVVTGVAYTNSSFHCLWYQTVGGGFGGFIHSAGNGSSEWQTEYNTRVKLLRYIELEVSHLFMQLACCDQIQFRNKHYPAACVVDFDMAELYSQLSEQRKEAIAARLREQFQSVPALKAYLNITPEIIEAEVNQFSYYFMDWQKKGK